MRALPTLLLIAALFLPALAAAEPPPPPPDEQDEEARELMMERLRIVRAAALTEALELDEATATRLFPYLREGDGRREQIHEARRDHMKALRQMVRREAVVEAEVDRRLGELAELEVEQARIQAEQLEGLKDILTPEQRIRYLLVRRHLEERVREVIREERLKRGRDRGWHGPPPEPHP
jgi:Spy/CpxP family protein refolding chaperone